MGCLEHHCNEQSLNVVSANDFFSLHKALESETSDQICIKVFIHKYSFKTKFANNDTFIVGEEQSVSIVDHESYHIYKVFEYQDVRRSQGRGGLQFILCRQ